MLPSRSQKVSIAPPLGVNPNGVMSYVMYGALFTHTDAKAVMIDDSTGVVSQCARRRGVGSGTRTWTSGSPAECGLDHLRLGAARTRATGGGMGAGSSSTCVSRADRYPDPLVVGDSLAQLAAVRAALGDDESAARTWGASTAIHIDQGIDPDRRRPRVNQHRLDNTRERLGQDRFDALSLAGSANPERVIAAILAGGHQP